MRVSRFLIVAALLVAVLLPQAAFAIPGPEPIKNTAGDVVVPVFDTLVNKTDPGDLNDLTSLVPFAINILRLLATAVTILFLVVAGYYFVTANGKEEQLTKAKHAIMYSVVGLVIIAFSRVITDIFFKYSTTDPADTAGSILNTTLAKDLIDTFINFGTSLLTLVTILFLVVAGYLFITASGKDEQLTKAKHSLMYAAAGLVTVTLARVFTQIFFRNEAIVTETTLGDALNEDLANATLQRLTDVGTLTLAAVSILFLLIAGYLFVTAAGKDEQLTKAKHSLMYGAIGLVVVTLARVFTQIFFAGTATSIVTSPTDAFDQTLAQRTVERFTDFGTFLLALVTVLFFVIAAYQFVTAAGKDEQLTKAKHSIMYGIAGLVLVTLASVITQIFFTQSKGIVAIPENAGDPDLGLRTVQTFVNFGELLLGAIAVLFLVIAGFQFITAAGKEEQLTKAKHSIMYSIAGLMAVVLAEVIVRTFFNVSTFGATPRGDVNLGIDVVITVTNFVLAFVGVIAVLMLVVAGFQYITARGNEDQVTKAKNSLMYSLIGIVVVIFAYVVVSIVVGGNV